MSQLDSHLEENASRHEERLMELLRIASVSADSAHAGDVQRAADWVAALLSEGTQLQVETIPTAGHPLVYAESPAVEGKPVVLIYGHYDVQPPDPLDEWLTPPFEPTVRNGAVYARGATDDKGQMLTHLLSTLAVLEVEGELPLQLKILIEGEEEVGSENLEKYVAENQDKLACDCVVISDSSQFAPGVPAVTYGLRGIAYYEVRLQGPKQDLHSGTFGGGVTNPANTLAKLLAALVDGEGRIQVPGFYDDVAELTEREREEFAGLPFDEAKFKKQLGVDGLTGEAGYSTLERRWARPTCDINGLWSGYQGEGAKTVLPAKAGAKFSFRLVPDQDPAKVTAGLRQLFEPLLPPGIEMELIDFHGAPGVVFPLESPAMEAAATAIEHGFGSRPVFIREGGSIPIVNRFAKELNCEVLLLGWGLDDDNTHSPNEKFNLGDFHRGIRSSAALWQQLSECGIRSAECGAT
ncbi:Succinyl-diaminopimelate desuccinylase [Pseudobythopirellula maris]|uniref:Succinyl-diaminopimelate desuccinylase n=1 Tax=Pseudobythopirellula maris TaxID=2527991 RepID=A0A5C5ZV36_9BACT|nr:dipeptidase [Pseudobythopirellula maris]TWT90791.1 Succinyl-diaminopimelate desuccinylase [Pseudobythopirellula maris]